MKFLFLICFTTIALSNAFSVDPHVGLMSRLCSRINVKPDNFELIKNLQFPNTPDIQQFLKCTVDSIKFWNNDTGFQVNKLDKLLKGLDLQILQSIKDEFERCGRETKQENQLKWAFDALECVLMGPMGDIVMEIIYTVVQELEG